MMRGSAVWVVDHVPSGWTGSTIRRGASISHENTCSVSYYMISPLKLYPISIMLKGSSITFLVASRQYSGSNFGTMSRTCQCNKDNRHEPWLALHRLLVTNSNAYGAVRHRCTVMTVPCPCYAKSNMSLPDSARAITLLCFSYSNKPFF
jgi:hypothetical protein